MSEKAIEHQFEAWWTSRGQYIDPDYDTVDWADKRKGLAAHAFVAAMAQSGNYVTDHAVTPKTVTFANGRQVKMGKTCLLVGREGEP